jgi:hypothetical protein
MIYARQLIRAVEEARRLSSRRAMPEPIPDYCGWCYTAPDPETILVVGGVGPRRLHERCAEAMRAFGYDVHAERRSGERRG